MRLGLDAGRHRREHLGELGGIGARALRRLLRAAQLRGRDHLHRLGDLLGGADGRDPFAQRLEARHLSGPS